MSWLVSNIVDPMTHCDNMLSEQKITADEYRSIQSKSNEKDKIRGLFYLNKHLNISQSTRKTNNGNCAFIDILKNRDLPKTWGEKNVFMSNRKY